MRRKTVGVATALMLTAALTTLTASPGQSSPHPETPPRDASTALAGTVDTHNLGVLQRAWLPARSGAANSPAVIGYVADSVAEGEGLAAGSGALEQRIIEKLQKKLRSKSGIPFCYPDPSIYKRSSTLIPGWYQSTPQLNSVELPKNKPVNTGWARNSQTGPGGRTANLALPNDSAGAAVPRGTSVTMQGTFSGFDLDYYTSSWGRNMEVTLDGTVLTTRATYEVLDAWKYGPRKYSWRDPSGAIKSHTLVITAIRDSRFNAGSVAIGGITPYDADTNRCEKVLDLSHGGFGYNFALEWAPQTIRDNVKSGTGSRGLDLMVLGYGYNDPAYYTPTEFGQAVQRYINTTRSHGYAGPILLVGMPTPSISSSWKVRDWKPYLDQLKARATWSNNAAYVGLDNVISPNPNGGVWSDTVHLNAIGTDLVAEHLAALLSGTDFIGNEHVALGDSFSAGVGTNSPDESDGCYRSVYGYAPQLALDNQLVLSYRACSGAVAWDVEVNQLNTLSDATDYVTITIGGNDVDFSSVITKCITSINEDNCKEAVADRQDELNEMPSKLAALFKLIRQKAPQADIAVGGYPHLVSTPTCIGVGNMNNNSATLISSKIDILNGYVKTAATREDMKFVDPVPSFAHHGACGGLGEWINGIQTRIVDSFHPNRSGNAEYQRIFARSFGFPQSAAPTAKANNSPAPRRASEATREDLKPLVELFRSLVRDPDSEYMQSMIKDGWGTDGVRLFRQDILSDDTSRWQTSVDWWILTRNKHDR